MHHVVAILLNQTLIQDNLINADTFESGVNVVPTSQIRTAAFCYYLENNEGSPNARCSWRVSQNVHFNDVFVYELEADKQTVFPIRTLKMKILTERYSLSVKVNEPCKTARIRFRKQVLRCKI